VFLLLVVIVIIIIIIIIMSCWDLSDCDESLRTALPGFNFGQVQGVFSSPGRGGYFFGVNQLERETDNSTPSSAEVNVWSYTSALPRIFMP
jgi:hypothetical protein